MSRQTLQREIRLVISDVDGTLVTSDKELTDSALQAVKLLREAGTGFTMVTGRPMLGVKSLIEKIHPDIPLAAFNGGAIFKPDFTLLEAHRLPADYIPAVIHHLEIYGLQPWLFTTTEWYVTQANSPYV